MAVAHSVSRSASRRPLVIMGAVAVVLTFWQHRAWRQATISLPEYLAFIMVSPLERVVSSAFARIHDMAVAAVRASELVEENRRLRRQIQELEAQRIMDVDVRLENKAFREKLGLELHKPFERVVAQVISRSSGRESRWVKVRAAGGKQLEVGNVVRQAKGLVGRVTEVSGSVAQVVLLTDPQHAVRAKDLRTGDEGMVYAASELTAGPDRLRFERMRRGAQVAVGDSIVTSGVGETYPAGIPIGVVEAVRPSPSNPNTLVAYIKPYVDFDRLDYVIVLRAGEQ